MVKIAKPLPFKMPVRKNALEKPTVVLFFGGGQDSTALLYKYYYDAEFRKSRIGDAHFLVIMADTGNEYPSTYSHVALVQEWCQRVGIEFYLVGPEMGYHGRTWQSLQFQMELNNTVMGVAFQKSCTDNLKVKVCYRFLADWLRANYHFTKSGVNVFYQYKAFFGKLRTWIGFAAGEESRVDSSSCESKTQKSEAIKYKAGDLIQVFNDNPKPAKTNLPKWRQLCVTHLYPLITLGYNRLACQLSISGYGHRVPFPSNCMMCPYQGLIEILYLNRKYPAMWAYWRAREMAKLQKFAHKEINYGVKGKLNLEKYLEQARSKYGHLTMDEIEEYRFSHGHCVKSKI